MTTVFLVGTGCESGAWQPITQAISRVDSKAPVEPGNADHANFWMAKLIALRRATYAAEKKLGAAVKVHAESQHRALRQEICSSLLAAQTAGSLTLRESFVRVFGRDEWGTSKTILSTNWDSILEETLKVPVVHIHGSTSDWESLYLPTDYAFDPTHSRTTQQRMFKEQDEAIRTLWRAHRVCIFGLSLDPLDAELALIVATGLMHAEFLQEVRICNLQREEGKLRSRLALLTTPEIAARITFEAV